MFVGFFYALRERRTPVTPTSFLKQQRAMSMGLINSIDDFYTAARAILIKSERYFDTYDRIFAHIFKGVAVTEPDELELTEIPAKDFSGVF